MCLAVGKAPRVSNPDNDHGEGLCGWELAPYGTEVVAFWPPVPQPQEGNTPLLSSSRESRQGLGLIPPLPHSKGSQGRCTPEPVSPCC